MAQTTAKPREKKKLTDCPDALASGTGQQFFAL